ncbi:MAG: hypothetical protein A2017_06570 [Lentisphaerae bacterium GWF2_44_16]|nr:MAG: hypothetical protein A2017_06570 [Lentisphaerae bacterium GWF2_44_16]
MPTENQIFDTFTALSTATLEKVYLPHLYEVAFRKKRSYLLDRLTRSSEGVKGLEVYLTFLAEYGWSFRPMSEMGYTPSGAPFTALEQKAKLGCHAATIAATLEAIMATDGDHSRIGDLLARLMKGVHETFPHYMCQAIWSGTSGVIGVVLSVSGSVVTLDNVGLTNTHVYDRAKYFVPGMFVQALTSAGVKRGDPVKVTVVDKVAGKITLSSIPTGLADNDMFVVSDIAGLENGYNQSTPGILDVIDDDNTFQNTDRSLAANANLRALVRNNSGTGRLPTYSLLEQFFYDCYQPSIAITDHRVINYIYEHVIMPYVRFTSTERKFELDFEYVTIGKTKLIEDEDAHNDKIIVPDLDNMQIRDKGALGSLFGKGWTPIQGRPFTEYNLVYNFLLIAEDCRNMGVLGDINILAEA